MTTDVEITRTLTCLELAEGYLPASQVRRFNPRRYDFRWTDDFAGFLPVKLLWWDDASYIRYQGDDDYHEGLDSCWGARCDEECPPRTEPAVVWPKPPVNDDEIPF